MDSENSNKDDSEGLSVDERQREGNFDSEDDEEEECRVCRGPVEEG